jgi:hypothetical protein
MNTLSTVKRKEPEMTESLTANPVTPYTEASATVPVQSGDRNDNYSESFDDHPVNVGEGSESFSSDEETYENGPDDDDSNAQEDQELSLEELLYSTNSFHAIVRPVSATMILAALAAVYINDEQTTEMGAEQLASAYNVWDIDNSGEGSTGKNLISSIGNALVMVTFIGTMTFGIVFLYKYRCMKFLIGYMVFSSASLLGLLGDYLGSVAIEIYRIPVDKISYSLFMYNFAIVGVTAIFYQKGIPQSVTQMYLGECIFTFILFAVLVAIKKCIFTNSRTFAYDLNCNISTVFTSVILAWHLAHFDDWTAWSLLGEFRRTFVDLLISDTISRTCPYSSYSDACFL